MHLMILILIEENMERPVAQLEYASDIESLIYPMHYTRSNIAIVGCKLSKFIEKPRKQHWKSITKILGYLKITISLGLHYSDYPKVLKSYSNVSWITSFSNNKNYKIFVYLWKFFSGSYYKPP